MITLDFLWYIHALQCSHRRTHTHHHPHPTHTHTHRTHAYRQRALKALDERLNKNDEPLSWPSLDDAGTSSQEEEISQAVGAVQLEAVVVQSHPPSVPTETITDQSKASSSASLQTAKTELV